MMLELENFDVEYRTYPRLTLENGIEREGLIEAVFDIFKL